MTFRVDCTLRLFGYDPIIIVLCCPSEDFTSLERLLIDLFSDLVLIGVRRLRPIYAGVVSLWSFPFSFFSVHMTVIEKMCSTDIEKV